MPRTALLPTTYLLVLALTLPRLAWAQPVPVGSEFQINTYVTATQHRSRVATINGRRYVVVWSGQSGTDSQGITYQRYDR